MIFGVDEAGRGPIAGPVSVGVVAVDNSLDLLEVFPGLNDSKKLSEKKREKLFSILEDFTRKNPEKLQYCVNFSSSQMIDEQGIVPSVQRALDEGVLKLSSNNPEIHVEKIYLDGSLHAPKQFVQETVIGGDARIPAIMLASVAAKVTRDRYMQELAKELPSYGFEKHKGYGTKAHYEAISLHGLSSQHRKSFLKSLSI